MPHIKRFSISGSAFWGWHTDIDLDDMDSNDDIVNEVKTRLLEWIKIIERASKQEDMYGLKRAVDDLTCYFHDMSFGDILLSKDDVIYICQCNHEHA